ncbi:MAG: hypothetical protein SGPRY_002290, partial [Prymnesium sp.]
AAIDVRPVIDMSRDISQSGQGAKSRAHIIPPTAVGLSGTRALSEPDEGLERRVFELEESKRQTEAIMQEMRRQLDTMAQRASKAEARVLELTQSTVIDTETQSGTRDAVSCLGASST